MNKLLNVQLVAHTPEPEQVIAAAAKLCYSAVGVTDIIEGQSNEDAERMVKMLLSMGHESPLEHVTFTFGIEGVSRIVETQLVRHRIASYSIQSGRYVKRDNPDFVIPNMILETPEALDVYNDALNETMRAYNDLVDILMEKQIKEYCELKEIPVMLIHEFYDWEKENTGKRKMYNKFEKIAIENARYIYPQALATKIVCTMNVRTLLNFMEHRICSRAQSEIQELAWAMRECIEDVSPLLASQMGASCMFGKCKEGRMSCGKPIKLKENE